MKTGNNEWSIMAENGNVLHVLNRCAYRYDAEERAKAWASTWSSVEIKVIDEPNRLGDKVPGKT